MVPGCYPQQSVLKRIFQGDWLHRAGRLVSVSLNIAGWFDEDQPGAPMNYFGMKRYGATPEARSPRLVIGPWLHGTTSVRTVGNDDYGPSAAFDSDAYTLRWFDHLSEGHRQRYRQGAARLVFVMGANKWYDEEGLAAPETRWTKYYLESSGKADLATGDGALTTRQPRRAGVDRYDYDPAHPTRAPYVGGSVEDGRWT